MSNSRTRLKTGATALTAALVLSLLAGSALAAEVSSLTRDDVYGGQYYHEALEHPQIAKIKNQRRKLKKIARSIGFTPKKLKKAIANYDAIEGDVAKLGASAIEGALDDTRVKGRVVQVLVDTREPKHVVAYVRWRGSKSQDVVKEASTIAHAVAEAAPFISTVSLAAIHPDAEDDTKTTVWQGKIGHDSMARISPKRIDDYADRLYARLFEGVESRPF